jgi:hypothetical protein
MGHCVLLCVGQSDSCERTVTAADIDAFAHARLVAAAPVARSGAVAS